MLDVAGDTERDTSSSAKPRKNMATGPGSNDLPNFSTVPIRRFRPVRSSFSECSGQYPSYTEIALQRIEELGGDAGKTLGFILVERL